MNNEELENIDLVNAFINGIPGADKGEKIKRKSWDDYFMDLAHLVSSRSTCRRHNVGAVLVGEGMEIISTGYNGAVRGAKDCLELGCLRDQLGIKSGTRHEICRAVHAEQNAIINAARQGVSTLNSTMYVTINPCLICAKMIINAGVKRVVYEGTYPDKVGVEFLKSMGVEVVNYKTDRLDRYVTKKY